MKVSMFVKDLKVSGGYQKLVLRLSQELKKLGHDVVVYTPFLNEARCYPDFIKEINIKYGEKTEEISEKISILKKIKRIFLYFKLISKYKKSDAIIIHDETSLITLNFINTKNIKTLWMLNNQFPDFLQPEYKDKSNGLKRTLKKVFFFLVRRGLKKVDTLLTYDRYNYDLVKKHTNNNVEIVYAGADIEIKDIQTKNTLKDPINLVSVGVLFEHRRYEDILKAVSLLKNEGVNTHLHIVGETKYSPEYLQKLSDLIEQHDIKEKITFTGAITDQELDKLYRTSDVFVFVNSGHTWGISVFEAMSYKLPTIITNNIGAIDLIKDENCSFIVNPKSPSEIATAIKRIRSMGLDNSNMTDNYKVPINMVKWGEFSNRIIASINNVNK